MKSRVFCGTFEAETYWREADLARLPTLPDTTSPRLVEAMDEMLFAFCDPGDTVLTAKCMDDAHADYLHTIGLTFNRNSFDLSPSDDNYRSDRNEIAPTIFQRILGERVAEHLEKLCPAGARLEPFAVVPGTAEVAKRHGLTGEFPSLEVIRAVNTKSYSLRMRDRVGIDNVGVTVGDVASLLDRGSVLLQDGPILVKDDYGVSGKGNQLIGSHRTLESVAKYLSAQAAAGKRVRFVLEPYLRKTSDFSCQFRIQEDGGVSVISVQKLINNGLGFGASCTARVEFLDRLEVDGYFQLIQKIGSLMYTDGYFGDVCVDSMVLNNGELAPLVEINARKSMSLIKNAIDDYLKRLGRKGSLTYVSAVNDQSSDFSGLLDLLERERVLFTSESDSGILPLTSGTMYQKSCRRSEEPLRGRLYIIRVVEKPEQQASLMAGFGRVMEQAGLHVVH